MLEPHGFEVLEAAAGEDAIALSDREDPDDLGLLVTDTIIPGPGGVELANRIRQRHPDVRTLIMSGYSEPPGGERELGPSTEFIAKPFSAADLNAKLAALLVDRR
jgi:CheY-like chemotaxis protein